MRNSDREGVELSAETIGKVNQIIDKHRSSLLEALRTGDLAAYRYSPVWERERGNYDLHHQARHQIARALQFSPELDTQTEALIRLLFVEEIKDRENDSFQGESETLEILAQLLKNYEQEADQALFARAKNANFDCYCGFEPGHPVRQRSISGYALDDVMAIMVSLGEMGVYSDLVDVWIREQTHWDMPTVNAWLYLEKDRKSLTGQIKAWQWLYDDATQHADQRKIDQALEHLLHLHVLLQHWDEALRLLNLRWASPDGREFGDQRTFIVDCLSLVVAQAQQAALEVNQVQACHLMERARVLWQWAHPLLKSSIRYSQAVLQAAIPAAAAVGNMTLAWYYEKQLRKKVRISHQQVFSDQASIFKGRKKRLHRC